MGARLQGYRLYLHSHLRRCAATTGVRTSPAAVWASGSADDEGNGGGNTAVADECVQDRKYFGDGWRVCARSPSRDSGCDGERAEDDSGDRISTDRKSTRLNSS